MIVQDKTASLKEKRKMREHVFHIYFFDLMLTVISVILCTLCVCMPRKLIIAPVVLFVEYLFFAYDTYEAKASISLHWQLNRTHLPGTIRTEIKGIRLIPRTVA